MNVERLNEFTTKTFQKAPNFFSSKEEAISTFKLKQNTNPKYFNFTQTHFTAGDEEQFQQYRNKKNGRLYLPKKPDNRFSQLDYDSLISFSKFQSNTVFSVDNTFHYLFYKFKKGIFIQIRNNSLSVFLPFSNVNFSNEWHSCIKVPPDFRDIKEFVGYVNKNEKRTFIQGINRFTDTWYANNCLLRYEFPVIEGDTNHGAICDMLEELCRTREVPDMEFFINRRDYPIMTLNESEAYDDLFGDNCPLLSHNYSSYSPIMSMVKREGYADIPMPTGEDWARISKEEGKIFAKACREYECDLIPIEWTKKKDIAVFRGASTGRGTTIETNNRLKLAHLSLQYEYLDAGITSWNLRLRKLKDSAYISTIRVEKLPFGLKEWLTPQQQSEYKYIVNVDGHVSAFRLSMELSMGVCVLLVDSEYKLWYSSLLKPYKHYVPVKKDLSDLIEKIEWCRSNDNKCRIIADNARKFASKYLTKKGVLDYFSVLLWEVKKRSGFYFYNIHSPYDICIKKEINLLPSYNNDVNTEIHTLPLFAKETHAFQKYISCLLYKIPLEYKKSICENLDLFEIANYPLLRLYCNNNESIHTMFVGMHLNMLRREIPNFCYYYGRISNELYLEYIPQSISLLNYLNSKMFDFHEFLLILEMIALSLEIAQRKYSFIHNNLTPTTIILAKYETLQTIKYNIDSSIVLSSCLVPKIKNFENSSIIWDNFVYAKKYESFDYGKDICMLIITCLYKIIERISGNKNLEKDILLFSSFLRRRPFRNLGELRFYLKKRINDKSFNIRSKTPIDLYNFIQTNFKLKKVDKKPNSYCGNFYYISNYGITRSDKQRKKLLSKAIHICKDEEEKNELNGKEVSFQEIPRLYEEKDSIDEKLFERIEEDINLDRYSKLWKNTIDYIVKELRLSNLKELEDIEKNENIQMYEKKIKSFFE